MFTFTIGLRTAFEPDGKEFAWLSSDALQVKFHISQIGEARSSLAVISRN